MKSKIISPDEFIENQWSGGTTTQLVIFPEGSNLADRDFDFRISSATFTSTSSNFSEFNSYQRYLLPLIGKLSVNHENLYSRKLDTYELEYFLGSWKTSSTNTLDCKDFNLIVKKGIQCNLSVLSEGMSYIPKKNGKLFLYSLEDFQICIATDNMQIMNVPANSLLEIQEEDILNKITLKFSTNPVIICEVIL